MISETLLEIIVCPETKQALKPADAEIVNELNKRISGGILRNRADEKILETMDSGLIREDGKILYPVRQDIPILLIDEGISL
jgi:uncharacterized protein YbaR (Trm112 family)